MNFCIDRFIVVAGTAIVVGWCELFEERRNSVTLLYDGSFMTTMVYPVDRPDVGTAFGGDARTWGFRAYGVNPVENPDPSKIGLLFDNENVIQSLAALPRQELDDPGALWNQFVEEVNEHGGTVLEIGSRARSGNTRRGLFSKNVKYIGMDVTYGENVDIVGDAHELSSLVGDVDFVYSVSVFEHLFMPWKVALEINKVLKIGGKVCSQSHQTWPAHDEPWDYFRFSREGWGALFNEHTGFRLCESRHGEPVSITSNHNAGGPLFNLDTGTGYGMTICVAEKIADPVVQWNARVGDLREICYAH